jgi:lipoprotein-anchoring transpeptidase ErfK/SrfK
MKPVLTVILCGCVVLASCNRAPAPTEPSSTAKPAELQPANIATNTPPAADPTDALLQQAMALKAAGKLADARALLQPLAAVTNASDKALALIGELNTQIIFTGASAPEKVDYTIVAGDSLGKLAKKFGTTIELIKRANGLGGDVIQIDNRLRIYQAKFIVEVSKSANTLTVTDNGRFFKRYRVGTGQFNRTPVGDFTIKSRVEKPPWYRPDGRVIPFGDPENVLGTHWLGLNVPRYGIHGTWETNSIGKQSSAGCIRLLNDDVAELFLLLPLGTSVTIHD